MLKAAKATIAKNKMRFIIVVSKFISVYPFGIKRLQVEYKPLIIHPTLL